MMHQSEIPGYIRSYSIMCQEAVGCAASFPFHARMNSEAFYTRVDDLRA